MAHTDSQSASAAHRPELKYDARDFDVIVSLQRNTDHSKYNVIGTFNSVITANTIAKMLCHRNPGRIVRVDDMGSSYTRQYLHN